MGERDLQISPVVFRIQLKYYPQCVGRDSDSWTDGVQAKLIILFSGNNNFILTL